MMLHLPAVKALDYFEGRGCVQLILSALPHAILTQSVSRFGIEGYFADVVGLNDNLARSKLENGQIMIEKSGADPQATIMIGDSALDIEVSRELGTRCLLVSRGYENAERLADHGCPVFESLDQLIGLI